MRRPAAWLAALALALPAAWAAPAMAQSLLGNSQDDQSSPVVVPPAPPVVAAPPSAPAPQMVSPSPQPPGLVQTPLPPPNSDTGADSAPADNGQPATSPPAVPAMTPPAAADSATAPGQPPAAPVPDTADSTPPPMPNNWVPEKTAQIGVLDKVDGGASTISVPVGGDTTVGDLQISVLACVTRPPDEIPDDAIFVAIQPAPGQPGGAAAADDASAPFRGWMVRSIPGATVVGDASETLRVIGCS